MGSKREIEKSLAGVVLRAARFVLGLVAKVTRPISLGVHAVVLDADERVMLVHHTYKPGWYLPGGAVNRGEDVVEAMKRELREELQIEAEISSKDIFSVYYAIYNHRHNHVVLFVVREWREVADAPLSLEIREKSFFSQGALPENTSRAVLQRLQELRAGIPSTPAW